MNLTNYGTLPQQNFDELRRQIPKSCNYAITQGFLTEGKFNLNMKISILFSQMFSIYKIFF